MVSIMNHLLVDGIPHSHAFHEGVTKSFLPLKMPRGSRLRIEQIRRFSLLAPDAVDSHAVQELFKGI